ncbi:MAG: MATE family efflux transporter [Muribaculaceae bacterium]|nr:MATE family efflux transporter [Muribaculaceae bacterium]
MIDREIIRLSIPTIFSNITVPLLGICDAAISGHLGNDLFLSAIAVASVMFNVVFWIFGFLRGGTTGLTANALGARDDGEVSKVFYRSLLIASGAGILLIIFQAPIFSFLWMVTGAGEEINGYVREYYAIRIWSSPALLAIIAISGWFVGMQNTFYPMVIAIAANVMNIGLSYTLAFPLEYGFSGVAYGTLIANWLGLLIAIGCVIIFRKGRGLRCSLSSLLLGNWKRYFSVNGNLFLRSFFIICVTMGVTAAGARLGNLTLAVNIIIMQFFQFFSFFMDGFAYSGEAMVGLYCGERNFKMIRECVKHLLWWTVGVSLLFTLIYFGGVESISSLLTDSESVVAGVVEMTLWVGLIPLVSCWSFIYDGFYIGMTATFKMMLSTLIGGIAFFLIINLCETGMSGIDGNGVIWSAFLSYLLLRGLFLVGLWPQTMKKNYKFAENKKR